MFFHALTFAGSQGCCLNTRLIGRVFKHLPRDPASVNAMKQICVMVVLAYFTLFHPKSTLKTLLKYLIVHFLTLDFSGCVLSNVITSSQRHNRTQRFREQNHRQKDQSGPQRFPYTYITSCK